MMNIFKMLRYPFVSGILVPFKIYCNAKIRIRNTAKVKLGGRVTIGESSAKSAIVSVLPANIYFGYESKINIAHSVSIGPGVNIIVKDNGILTIGENTYFTSDQHIEIMNALEIGSNCAISWGVTIIDDDHHELLSDQSKDKTSTAVTIKNHVWIGCNVTILKGTQIGSHCVVAAGSIVKGVFPDNVLLAGNPAKIIRKNINWK
jgi:acetyltransferase-like isoleucine patch superfamily enzyme